jgi:hypothetical protein
LKTDQLAKEVEEQVEDGEDILDPDNTTSVVSTLFNAINNELKHKCRDEAVRLLNAHPVQRSTYDRDPGVKYSIPGLSGTTFWARRVWASWFIVR